MKVAVAGTGDARGSPSAAIIRKLLERGAKVRAYDPSRPRPGQTESTLANAGYFVMRSGAVAGFSGSFKLESECFPRWAGMGMLLGRQYRLPYWMDIGTLESYREANRMVESVLPPPGGIG